MSRVVWHLVDAMGVGEELWGKERVIADVLAAQQRAGFDPRLICFGRSGLEAFCRRLGFPAHRLEAVSHRIPRRALPALLAILRREPGAVLHTHGYKANIIGRIARLAGAPISRLVATCHGWPNETRATRTYNALDRWSAFLSDAVTVPDRVMLGKFPRFARQHAMHVANGIPDWPPATGPRRDEARRRFEFPADAFIVGSLGRFSEEKGISEALVALGDPRCKGILWAFGGSGALEWAIRGFGPSARCAGFVTPSHELLDGLDAYVQTSRSEGLSLGLLEAMRAALPIVATDVGATSFAVRDEREALLVPPRDLEALVSALVRLRENPQLCRQLGDAARARFEQHFRIERVAGDFLRAYGVVR
jgi:glycosyltransferase involved in cell wall biosynthesis